MVTFLLCFAFVASVQEGLSSETLRQIVNEALDWSGWPIEAAAAQMGMSRQRLSEQLRGNDPLTFLGRSWMLSGFLTELGCRLAERSGAVVVKHTDLQVLITEVKALTKRRMARAELSAKEIA